MEKEKKPAKTNPLQIAVILILVFGVITGCFFVVWQISGQKSSKKTLDLASTETQKEVNDLNKKIDDLNSTLAEIKSQKAEAGEVKGSATENTASELININTASAEQLDTLDGIGPAYAQKIIEYRTANGGFKSIEEIKNVKGIGDKTFEKIANSITI
jgi:competence protein ComEA